MAITIRRFLEGDEDEAERLRRLAFGTMFGLPDPLQFRGDAALLPARRRVFADGGVIAEEDGAMIGLAMANRWGRLGVLGPIAVHPARWRGGVARELLAAAVPIFERWDCRLAGLFTFPERATHLRLYQAFGFWPRSLIAIMARPVTAPGTVSDALSLAADAARRASLIAQCAELTATLYDGLDLAGEIAIALGHAQSDAILIAEGSRIAGLAIIHCGLGSEAGANKAYVKFACVRPGADAARQFGRLVAACSDFAYRHGATELSAGVNLGRNAAYRLMLDLGFRAGLQGVAMHRPWIEAYDRPEIFALDDWR